MKKIFLLLCAAVFGVSVLAQQAYNVRAPFDPATVKMAEDKRGEVLKFTINDSKYYPGTEREILVYVPQSYQSNETACLLVCMDGILYDATTVMDNLIASGEMPVTVGVFVTPGVVYDEDREVVRYNRCKEFDSTDDTFARFLEEEVLTLLLGFLSAFVSGLLACKLMIALVKKARLSYFAVYCLIAAAAIFIFG